MATKKIILVLDRLGTRGIWLRENHETIVQKYSEVIDEVDKLKEQFRKNYRFFYEGSLPNIDSYFFSDTLMLLFHIAPNLPGYQTLSYVTWMAGKVLNEGFKRKIFFRGAMSIGDVYYKEHYPILVGPAIDEVTEWYESSEWIGIHSAPSMHYYIEKNSGSKWFQYAEYLIKYSVPIKDYPNFSSWAVNWPSLMIYEKLNEGLYDNITSLEEVAEVTIRKQKDPNYKSEKATVINNITERINDLFSQSVLDARNFQKFENTKAFYDYVVKKISN